VAPITADATEPHAVVDCHDVPTPKVIRFDSDIGRQGCSLSGEYTIDNVCLITNALSESGFSWNRQFVIPKQESSKGISTARYHDPKSRLIINPRRSGEVVIDVSREIKYYCVDISRESARFVLWTILSE
jgi:hypothetical protein